MAIAELRRLLRDNRIYPQSLGPDLLWRYMGGAASV